MFSEVNKFTIIKKIHKLNIKIKFCNLTFFKPKSKVPLINMTNLTFRVATANRWRCELWRDVQGSFGRYTENCLSLSKAKTEKGQEDKPGEVYQKQSLIKIRSGLTITCSYHHLTNVGTW